MSAAPNIYSYLDYRAFLRDHYTHRKAVASFSHRAFAQKAGFRSPNYLKLVMDGERNLGVDRVPSVARACRLDESADDYLGALVHLSRSKSVAERSDALERVLSFEERMELYPLEKSANEYFSRWWIPVVRELMFVDEFQCDAQWIADALGGRVDRSQAAKALETLERLGMLSEGSPVVLDSVSPGDELHTTAMKRYQQALLTLASDAVADIPSHRRDISSITITGNDDTFEEAKRMVQRFRKELLRLERRASTRDQVFQFALQLFPVAETRRKGDHYE